MFPVHSSVSNITLFRGIPFNSTPSLKAIFMAEKVRNYGNVVMPSTLYPRRLYLAPLSGVIARFKGIMRVKVTLYASQLWRN